VRARQGGEHAHRAVARIDAKDLVAGVVGHVHEAVGIEADAVAGAARGQRHEQVRASAAIGIEGHPPDRAAAAEAHRIQRTVRTEGRTLDAFTERAVTDDIARDVQRFHRRAGAGGRVRMRATGQQRSKECRRDACGPG